MNKKELDKRVKNGLIYCKRYEDLTIYNYTPEVQFKKLWDEYTLVARGLILNNKGDIVARPWAKFFNLNEIPETEINSLDESIQLDITVKMDGSLGILYKHKGEWKIATRGSFDSDQAKKATKILNIKYANSLSKLEEFTENTLLFEIIELFILL